MTDAERAVIEAAVKWRKTPSDLPSDPSTVDADFELASAVDALHAAREESIAQEDRDDG